MMEANFSAHPVYHQKPRHFTIENIIETLNNMEVTNIEDMCYISTYSNSQVCTALNAVFGLGLDKKYYQPKELNKKISK